MKNRKLLFFFSDENCSSCTTVIPTLAALAREMSIDFETYICTRAWSWQGAVLPTAGNGHMESFYYLANFYDEIYYCSITTLHSYQFRREVLAFGGSVLSTREDSEVVAFYQDVFGFFGKKLPKTALVLPDAHEGERNYTPYCYRDIMRLNAMGLTETAYAAGRAQLEQAGVSKFYAEYCAPEGTDVLDTVKEGDRYASVTERIADRNMDGAAQVGFIDPKGLMRWLTYFCRKNIVAVYEDYEWIPFMKTVKHLADQVNNCDIIGNQLVLEPKSGIVRNNDAVIAELGKSNLIHNLLGVNPRIGFTIQTDYKLPLDWMEDPHSMTPWDDEYSDEFLIEKIRQRAVPVCFLFYAADLGHLPVLTNFLNMTCLDGMRAGIAFPSTWYDYHPEWVEQIYLPLQQGGVCPNLEPLVSSVGSSVATEAEGYISPESLTRLISNAKQHIAENVGERRVPKGIYPFQDSSPFYVANTGTPQYDVVSKLGFEYYVTYKRGGERAGIVYEGNGMTVLTQQIPHWFPGAGNPLEVVQRWEAECAARREAWKNGADYNSVDWIMLGFDTPFFALAPNYLGEIEYDAMRTGWAKYSGIHHLYSAMQYVRRTGGADGSLFMVKPHELYRFAKLAESMGLLRHTEESNHSIVPFA